MNELLGVSLNGLEGPIREALTRYEEVSDESIEFDLDAACKLELTPTKTNSARSKTTVKYLGNAVSDLYVIAFAPQDGTGAEGRFKLSDIDTDGYPREDKVIPRSKADTASEAHLTILSRALDAPNSDPVLFAGNFDLLSGAFGHLEKIADLGQDGETYRRAMLGDINPKPISTLTVGYRGTIANIGDPNYWNYWRKRFGDPHAVFNNQDDLQICGFVGISSEGSTIQSLDPLRALKSVEPSNR